MFAANEFFKVVSNRPLLLADFEQVLARRGQ